MSSTTESAAAGTSEPHEPLQAAAVPGPIQQPAPANDTPIESPAVHADDDLSIGVPDVVPSRLALTEKHQRYLIDNAIDIDVAIEAGVLSISAVSDLPDEIQWAGRGQSEGLLFVHQTVDGRRMPQYRPDKPKDPERKYLFPSGSGSIISVHPRMLDRVGRASKVVFVEGTKQYLAAVSAATAVVEVSNVLYDVDRDSADSTKLGAIERRRQQKKLQENGRITTENSAVLYIGVQGCYSYSSDGVPTAGVDDVVRNCALAVIAFDGDIKTNWNVWSAGKRLRDHLAAIGVAEVNFVSLPVSAKQGMDDYLAGRPLEGRQDCLRNLTTNKTLCAPLTRRAPRRNKTQMTRHQGAPIGVVDWAKCEIREADTEGDDNEPGKHGQILMTAAARIIKTTTIVDEINNIDPVTKHDLEVAYKFDGKRKEVILKDVPNADIETPRKWLSRLGGEGSRIVTPGGYIAAAKTADAIRGNDNETLHEKRHANTGWIEVDDEMAYAHESGCVTHYGSSIDTGSSLKNPLYRHLHYPDLNSVTREQLRDACRKHLSLIWMLKDPTALFVGEGGMAFTMMGGKSWGAHWLMGPAGKGKTLIAQTMCSFQGPAWAYGNDTFMITMASTVGVVESSGKGLENATLFLDDVRDLPSIQDNEARDRAVDKKVRLAYQGGGVRRTRLVVNRETGDHEELPGDKCSPGLSITAEISPPEGIDSTAERVLTDGWPPDNFINEDGPRLMDELARDGTLNLAWAWAILWTAQQIYLMPANSAQEKYAMWKQQHLADSVEKCKGVIMASNPSLTHRQAEVAAAPIVGWQLLMWAWEAIGVFDEPLTRNEVLPVASASQRGDTELSDASKRTEMMISRGQKFIDLAARDHSRVEMNKDNLVSGALLTRLRQLVDSNPLYTLEYHRNERKTQIGCIVNPKGGQKKVALLPGPTADALKLTPKAVQQKLKPYLLPDADGNLTQSITFRPKVKHRMLCFDYDVFYPPVSPEDDVAVKTPAAQRLDDNDEPVTDDDEPVDPGF